MLFTSTWTRHGIKYIPESNSHRHQNNTPEYAEERLQTTVVAVLLPVHIIQHCLSLSIELVQASKTFEEPSVVERAKEEPKAAFSIRLNNLTVSVRKSDEVGVVLAFWLQPVQRSYAQPSTSAVFQ